METPLFVYRAQKRKISGSFDFTERNLHLQKKICEGTFNEDGTLIERCSPYKQKKYVKGFRLVRKLK